MFNLYVAYQDIFALFYGDGGVSIDHKWYEGVAEVILSLVFST